MHSLVPILPRSSWFVYYSFCHHHHHHWRLSDATNTEQCHTSTCVWPACLSACTCMPSRGILWRAYHWLLHTHTRLTALCPGLPGWAGTRKVKPIWILLKQETVSGSDISWAICKSAPRSRQTTTPAPTTQFFTGRMPFLPPNQQCQSTEGTDFWPLTSSSL